MVKGGGLSRRSCACVYFFQLSFPARSLIGVGKRKPLLTSTPPVEGEKAIFRGLEVSDSLFLVDKQFWEG